MLMLKGLKFLQFFREPASESRIELEVHVQHFDGHLLTALAQGCSVRLPGAGGQQQGAEVET